MARTKAEPQNIKKIIQRRRTALRMRPILINFGHPPYNPGVIICRQPKENKKASLSPQRAQDVKHLSPERAQDVKDPVGIPSRDVHCSIAKEDFDPKATDDLVFPSIEICVGENNGATKIICEPECKKFKPDLNEDSKIGQESQEKSSRQSHPPPLPPNPKYYVKKVKRIPPKPFLRISKNENGIVLSWDLNLSEKHAAIQGYQLFSYEETEGPGDASLWMKKAVLKPHPRVLNLQDAEAYCYFTIRAIDEFKRAGPFSDPVSNIFEEEV